VSRAERAAVDADGVFEAPERVGQAVAEHHDTTAEAIRVDGDAGDGCPYCDAYDGDYPAQHIAQAHPEEDTDE
jgi:hypothetical protein